MIGAEDIEIWDGRNRAHQAPVPDLVASLEGRRVAVECGTMVGGREARIKQLHEVGYEIVIHLPYLECFNWSMSTPKYGPATWTEDEISQRIKSMGEVSV